MTDLTTVTPSRRNLMRGAAWTVPVVAVAATAPAFAVSPSINNSINGYVAVTTNKSGSNATIRFDSDEPGTVDGIPYGLFLTGTNAADVIEAMRIEIDVLGANIPDIFGSPGNGWSNGQRLGNVVQKDGQTYTRFVFYYSGGLTNESNPTRRSLSDFVITSGSYNPPVGTNVTYWVRRFVTINGTQRFFQRRNGDLGFIDYFGEGPGNTATPISGRVTASKDAVQSEGESSTTTVNV